MSESEKKPDQVFVVQRMDAVTVVVGWKGSVDDGHVQEEPVTEKRDYWVDIATVSIPSNTPRRIALKQALEGLTISQADLPVKLRALDAKSAKVHEPEAHQPPLEWRL